MEKESFDAHLTDVYPSFIFIISPIAHSQAQLVLYVCPVQIHFLRRTQQLALNCVYTLAYIAH